MNDLAPMRQLSSITQPISPAKFAHFALRTGQFDKMAKWWARINQCGRLAPADRAACTALSLGRAEGQRRAKARLDPALVGRWFAGDRDAACRTSFKRPVLPL